MHEFTNADVALLLKIQEEFRAMLRKYGTRVPAIVPAVACVRIAKALLDVYPEAERKETIETTIIPFLLGETKSRPAKGKSRLILPPGTLN